MTSAAQHWVKERAAQRTYPRRSFVPHHQHGQRGRSMEHQEQREQSATHANDSTDSPDNVIPMLPHLHGCMVGTASEINEHLMRVNYPAQVTRVLRWLEH